MDLPRDEIAFRADYELLVYKQTLTTVFRPGNRIYPNWRGYKLGEVVTGRIIERCGCDERSIPPVFKRARVPLRIARIEALSLADLAPSDFGGSSADVCDVDSLKAHINRIYSKPLGEYDNIITRIELEYLQPNQTILRA